MATNKKHFSLLIGVLLLSITYLIDSQKVKRTYKVAKNQYPSDATLYPSMSTCTTGCDLMRCLMECTNNDGCNAMGYGSGMCYYLMGRVLNTSSIQASTLSYYEKSCNYIKLYYNNLFL